jgi:hypothetical protein
MVFDYIQYLPDDIIDIIFEKLSPYKKMFLNKELYIKFNPIIDPYINNSENYIRDIIRKDYSLVFKFIVERKFKKWLCMRNYSYNNIIYPDYVHFLLFFTSTNNAYKCNNLINLQLNLSGLKKEWRKNSRIKYNKWSN